MKQSNFIIHRLGRRTNLEVDTGIQGALPCLEGLRPSQLENFFCFCEAFSHRVHHISGQADIVKVDGLCVHGG